MPITQTFKIAGHEWTVAPLDSDEQIEVECILLQLAGPPLAAAAASLVQGLAPALVEILRDTVGDTNQATRVLAKVEARLALSVPAAIVTREDVDLVLTFADIDVLAAAFDAVCDAFGEHMMVVADADESDLLIRITVTPEVLESDTKKFELSRLLTLDTSDPRLHMAWERLTEALAATGGDLVRDAVTTLAGRLDHRALMRLFELVLLGKTKTLVTLNGRPAYVADSKTLSKLLARNPRAKWDLLGRALWVTYGPDPTPDEPEGDGDA